MLIVVLASVLFYADFTLKYFKSQISAELKSALTIVSKVMRSIFTVQSNLGIIVAYLIIFMQLRKHYV